MRTQMDFRSKEKGKRGKEEEKSRKSGGTGWEN